MKRTSSTIPAQTATPASTAARIAIINIANLSQSCFSDLEGLFRAIGRLSDDAEVKKLCRIGYYLADDWWQLVEAEANEYREKPDVMTDGVGK